MLANLFQLNNYIDEYCAVQPSLSWCEEQLADFAAMLDQFNSKVEYVIKN